MKKPKPKMSKKTAGYLITLLFNRFLNFREMISERINFSIVGIIRCRRLHFT